MKILIKNKRCRLKLLTDEVDFRAKNISIDKVGNEIMMKDQFTRNLYILSVDASNNSLKIQQTKNCRAERRNIQIYNYD